MNTSTQHNVIYENFEEAGKQVLRYLHRKYGFGLWMITRVEGDDWIVLQAENEKYDIQVGNVFRWKDSFCYHMVQGKTPKIAPRAQEVECYAQALINHDLKIASYIGQALLHEDGSVFGTICAIDTEPKSDEILSYGPLIELLSDLLSSILQSELRENQQRRLKERFEVEALTDGLTGLFNRRAWDRLLAAEEGRCQRYGLAATLYSIDLNDLKFINDQYGHDHGDRYIQKVAEILLKTTRINDVVARLGGDEFAVLCPEVSTVEAEIVFDRLLRAFAAEGIHVAMGYATRMLNSDLNAVLIQADQRMYEHKRQMKLAH